MAGIALSEVTRAVHELSQCSVGADYEERLFGVAVDFAMAQSGFDKGTALTSGLEHRPLVAVNRGVDEAYNRFVIDNYVRLPGMQAVDKVEPLVVRDTALEPAYAAARQLMAQAKIRSLAVFPARVFDQEIFGSIVIYHSKPKTIDPQIVAAIQAVVDHAAMAVTAARLRFAREYLLQQTLLEQSQNVISVVAAGIAHDFNNMLGGMLGLVTLAPSMSPHDLTSLCHRLADEVKHAAQLTRNLLDLAHGTQNPDGQPRATEVGEALRQVEDLVRTTVPPTIRLQVEPLSHRVWVSIGPTALSRVLLNLVINAVQALATTRDGSIVLRAASNGGVCSIEVDDNGPGVPADKAEQVFQPFVSIGKSGGSGVGLAAARGIIERAGGSLFLKHREGPGACFVARLAVITPDLGDSTPTVSASPMSTSAVFGNRLLVAEDEPIQRQVFVLALTRAGFVVDAVENGEEARKALERGGYEAALLDHSMPGMTGASLLAAIRRRNDVLPVVLVTGFGGDPQLTALAADGHTRVLPKPVDGDAVVRIVREMLRG